MGGHGAGQEDEERRGGADVERHPRPRRRPGEGSRRPPLAGRRVRRPSCGDHGGSGQWWPNPSTPSSGHGRWSELDCQATGLAAGETQPVAATSSITTASGCDVLGQVLTAQTSTAASASRPGHLQALAFDCRSSWSAVRSMPEAWIAFPKPSFSVLLTDRHQARSCSTGSCLHPTVPAGVIESRARRKCLPAGVNGALGEPHRFSAEGTFAFPTMIRTRPVMNAQAGLIRRDHCPSQGQGLIVLAGRWLRLGLGLGDGEVGSAGLEFRRNQWDPLERGVPQLSAGPLDVNGQCAGLRILGLHNDLPQVSG